MFFDRAARGEGVGAGVIFVSPKNHILPYPFTLTQLCSNNVAEYQALLFGLQMAMEISIDKMDIYVRNSQLAIIKCLTTKKSERTT